VFLAFSAKEKASISWSQEEFLFHSYPPETVKEKPIPA
jgi:hypothetical protein